MFKNIEFHDFTVSNETILVTKQEFFLYKSSYRKKHNWHCTIEIFINTAPVIFYFILHYCLFFRAEFFFECSNFSEYHIQMFLFVFWLKGGPSTKYVRN